MRTPIARAAPVTVVKRSGLRARRSARRPQVMLPSITPAAFTLETAPMTIGGKPFPVREAIPFQDEV